MVYAICIMRTYNNSKYSRGDVYDKYYFDFRFFWDVFVGVVI